MARKIAIAIHKGGVGKTTTAKNLAAALALKGKRTLLIDLDEQANATKGMGINPSELPATINDLFADPSRDAASVLVATDIEGLERLHILPAHSNLAKTETGMALLRSDPNNPDPIGTLKGIIAPLDEYYDFMIFDTPPSLNYMTINALAAADELLIPAAASAYSEDGLNRTVEAYERAKTTYNPALKPPYILVTRTKRTNASNVVLGGINEAYADRIIPQLIVESTAVDEAEQLQLPVLLYDYRNPAAQGYLRVAEILINGQ
ncbi:MAG TPA: ParA family protein [Ktedonobacteraceae bacterium]|nr:ParA family protein [Ktedonobacteraceae bacterium]